MLECPHVRITGQHEQIPDLLEVDLPAGPAVEVPERVEAPPRKLDVQHIRELCPDAPGRSAGRAAAKLCPLDQGDVDSGLGEMERRTACRSPRRR